MSRPLIHVSVSALCAFVVLAGFCARSVFAAAPPTGAVLRAAPLRPGASSLRPHPGNDFVRAGGAAAGLRALRSRALNAATFSGSSRTATAAARAPQSPPNDAPSLLQDFAGNQQQDAINTYSDQALFPPDSSVAAGPNAVVETTNDRILAFDKSGNKIFDADINSFAGVTSGYSATDPRILYDAGSARFIFSVMDYQLSGCGSHVYVFASPASGNLSDVWNGVRFGPAVAGTSGDQPGLGVSNNMIAISWNLFSCTNGSYGNAYGDQFSLLQKSDVINGTVGSKTLDNFSSQSDFSAEPVQELGSNNDQYFIENGSLLGDSRAYVYTFTGTPEQGNVGLPSSYRPAIAQTSQPPLAPQSGTSRMLETDDDRFLNAAWESGTMWTAATTACTPSGDTVSRSCLAYFSVTTNSSGSPTSLHQVPFYGVSGEYLYYPAVSLDNHGNLFTAFNESSSSSDPSIVAAAIDTLAGGTTLTSFNTLASSATFYDPGGGYSSRGGARWGDYNGAAQDPANPTDVWVVGEDVESALCPNNPSNSCWDTHIGRYTLSGPVITGVSPAAGPTAGGQAVTITGSDFLPGSTVTLGGTSASSPSITPDSIQINTPAHAAPGLVYAHVSDALGGTSTSSAAGYVYTDLGIYTPVTPFRIYDSRSSTCVNCNNAGPVTAGSTRIVPIVDSSITSGTLVPSSASAVVLNVTAVNESSRGFMSMWPTGTAEPSASALNFNPSVTVANLVVVVLGQTSAADGNREVDIAVNTGSTNVVIDVQGFFAPQTPGSNAGTFHPMPPLRICDSRGVSGGVTNNVCNGNNATAQPLGSGSVEKINVSGPLPGQSCTTSAPCVPADGTAEAVVLNLTAVLPQFNTYLSVFPTSADGTCASGTPPSSNLNLLAGGVQPNRVMVPLGPDTSGGPNTDICVWNYAGPTNFIVDLNGWYGNGSEAPLGDQYQAIGPTRVCDSRSWASTPCSSAGPLTAAITHTVTVTTGAQAAVLMNVTAVVPSANTYIAVYPADSSRTASSPSDLNPRSGITMPNCVVVELSSGATPGQVDIYNNAGTVNFIFDVAGWFQ